MFFGSFLSESVSPQNLFGHPDVERCPFLNQYHRIDVRTEPALPFNPLAARAATISLSAFGPFGFGFFNGKGKRQNKKPNNLDQSHQKPILHCTWP